jgi:type VI protein secretion system component VasK
MQDAVSRARSAADAVARGFAIGAADPANREVTRLLREPSTSSQRLAGALPALEAGRAMRDFCSRFGQLTQLFPFSDSPRLATPDDLTAMFHPTDGELTKLVDETLKDVIVKRGSTYERNPGSAVPQNFVDFLNRALRVGATVFPDGSGPRLLFAIRLVVPTTATEVTLNLDGQSITRTPANQTVQPVAWRFNDPRTSSASLRVVLRGGATESVDFPGSWGIFRLFGAATWVTDPSGASHRLTWRVPVDRQTVEVSATISPNNNGVPVLEPRTLTSLRCPR